MKWIFAALSLALATPLAAADVAMRAEYHPPTNLFILMDEAALWYPGYNDTAHREAWTARFGWSADDQAMARRYKNYRKRTFDDSDQTNKAERLRRDGVFSTGASINPDTDPLAQHFIAAESVDAALSAFDTIASADDAAMLREFYDHFSPEWRALLEESEAFAAQAARLDEELSDETVGAFATRMAAFYGVEADQSFRTRLVWWPAIDRTFAFLKGATFLLYRHPERHAAENDRAEIVMHEAAHYFSASQPSERKRRLTEAFFEICPARTQNLHHFLEEPLAVAWGQAAFAKYGRGEPLDPSTNWYRPPIPDVMGRLLWLHVDRIYETDATIEDGVVLEAASYCARLLEIGRALKRKRW
ncbi:MAG: hypothetical protein ACFB00_07185 [Parvularculaceae bacterium]